MATFDIADLARLADRSDGPARLGELLRRLIWATLAQRDPSVHFLAGATNNEAGWDGHVQCPIGVNGVDEMHRSVWEVSARTDVEKKILEDYPEAVNKTLPFDIGKSHVVYVAATLRRVTARKKASIVAKLERDFGNPWAQIRILDATDLVQWIEKVPSVEVWLSGEFDIGRLRYGRALEHIWNEWRGKTVPQVTEQLISCGRPLSRVQEALRFAGRAAFSLRCESIDEGLAVLYSAIRAMPEQDSALLLSNALVVKDVEAAKALANVSLPQNGMPLTILTPPATTESQLLVAKGHLVVHVLARDDGQGSPITLERAVVHDFATALSDSMGIPHEEAISQARACGCSVSVWHVRQLFAAGQQPELPVWAQAEHADSVVLAIFLGGWCEESEADSEAIKALSGLDAAAFTDPLRKFMASAQPLLQFIDHDRFVRHGTLSCKCG